MKQAGKHGFLKINFVVIRNMGEIVSRIIMNKKKFSNIKMLV
jgi:hypothetical protein